MTKDDTLLELAAKCEKATEPERELDGAIWAACSASPPCPDHTKLGKLEWPDYTASLDAAMTLVPEGYAFTVSVFISRGPRAEVYDRNAVGGDSDAATPALALCAAALRARASAQQQEGGSEE